MHADIFSRALRPRWNPIPCLRKPDSGRSSRVWRDTILCAFWIARCLSDREQVGLISRLNYNATKRTCTDRNNTTSKQMYEGRLLNQTCFFISPNIYIIARRMLLTLIAYYSSASSLSATRNLNRTSFIDWKGNNRQNLDTKRGSQQIRLCAWHCRHKCVLWLKTQGWVFP